MLLSLFNVNVGNARVAGLQKDLKLTDNQYQICITALYVYVYNQVMIQVAHYTLPDHTSYRSYLQTCYCVK